MSQDKVTLNLSVTISSEQYNKIVSAIKQKDPNATELEIRCFLERECRYWLGGSADEFENDLDLEVALCFPTTDTISPLYKIVNEQKDSVYVPDTIKPALKNTRVRDW